MSRQPPSSRATGKPRTLRRARPPTPLLDDFSAPIGIPSPDRVRANDSSAAIARLAWPSGIAAGVFVAIAAVMAAAVAPGIAAGTARAEPGRAIARFAPVVGMPSVDLVAPGDTLLDIAERHRLGFERVARLNPEVDAWIPPPGTRIRLPTQHVLPDAPHEGLVVNLPELQLYDYGVDREMPEVLALAIGDELDPSLVGTFRVGRKRANPVWHVPESIRAERPELPAEVPPGPDNPLGPYWLTIGQTSYGLHGTNNRWSIGREATHGCLRLYNDVVERLFERTRTGTPIRILYQTVKLGLRDGIVYVEAHPDRYRRDPNRLLDARARLAEWGLDDDEVLSQLERVIEAARGEPVAIGVLPDAPVPRPTSPPATSTPTS